MEYWYLINSSRNSVSVHDKAMEKLWASCTQSYEWIPCPIHIKQSDFAVHFSKTMADLSFLGP